MGAILARTLPHLLHLAFLRPVPGGLLDPLVGHHLALAAHLLGLALVVEVANEAVATNALPGSTTCYSSPEGRPTAIQDL